MLNITKDHKRLQRKCWKLVNERGFFHIRPDFPFGHKVGIKKKDATVNESILGEGKTFEEACVNAIRELNRRMANKHSKECIIVSGCYAKAKCICGAGKWTY